MKSWKTTVGGILIAMVPVFQNVPQAWAYWVAKALFIIGPILLGAAARDNKVTSEQAGAGEGSGFVTQHLLLFTALLSLSSLTACAWIQAHKSQLWQTGTLVGEKAAGIALGIFVDNKTTAGAQSSDWLQSAAVGVATSIAKDYSSVTDKDIAKVIQIWTPADKSVDYQKLASELSKLYASSPGTPEHKTQEIAAGLGKAADVLAVNR